MQPYGKSGSWLSFIFVVFVFCFLFFLCYVSKQRRWTKSKTKSGSSGHVVKFQILSSFLYFLSNKQSKFVFVLLVFLLSKNIDEIIYLVRFSSFILSINRFLEGLHMCMTLIISIVLHHWLNYVCICNNKYATRAWYNLFVCFGWMRILFIRRAKVEKHHTSLLQT